MSIPSLVEPRLAISTSNESTRHHQYISMSLKDLIPGNESDDEELFKQEEADSDAADDGSTDEDSSLSQRELAKLIRDSNQDFEQADEKREAYQEKIQKLLEKGSQTENSDQRRVLALLIRQMKQRAAVMDLKQQASLRDLFKYTLEKEVQDIHTMLEDELNRESPMDEFQDTTDEFTEQFDQVAASVQSEINEMNGVMSDLSASVEGAQTQMVGETLPEEEQMDRIAEEELDVEEIELDIDPQESHDSSGEFLNSEGFDDENFDEAAEEFFDDSENGDLAASLVK